MKVVKSFTNAAGYKRKSLVIAARCARSSTSMATCTKPPSSCDIHGGTGASYNTIIITLDTFSFH